MAITFLDEEEDIVAAAEPPKGASRITFLDEEEPEAPALGGFSIPAAPERPRFEETKPSEGVLRQSADLPVQFAIGITNSVKGLTDLFGADNAVSQNLSQNADWYRGLLSASAKQDEEEVGRILQEAEGKGMLDQLSAGLEAFTVAPADFVASGLGSLATFAATGIAGRAAAAAGAARAGLTGAAAAKAVETGVRATQLATGAAMGAGIVKGEIYQSVKDEMLAKGKTEEESRKIAMEAQSYMGKNLDQILLGAGLGTIDAFTGAEKILGKVLTKGGLKPDASRIGSIIKNGITEAAPEFVQAAQEKFASNLALRREGADVSLTQGVFSQGALEGLVGLGMGVGAGAVEPRVQAPPTKEQVSAAAAETQDVARQNKDVAPATASLVEDEAERIVKGQAETPDEKVARLQREAQEAAGEIELEEEGAGLPPVEPTPPVTPTPEAAVAPVEPVVPAEGAVEPTAPAAPTEPVAPTGPTAAEPVPAVAPRPAVDVEALSPNAKRANRILTNTGVDPETAAFVAQQYEDEIADLGGEELRAFILDKFEENGGVIPAQMRYSEDQEYYELAFGIGPEEAATLVENAKAQNAQMAQAELEQNKQWRRQDEQVTEAQQGVAVAKPEAQAVPVPAGEVPPSPAIEGRRVPLAAPEAAVTTTPVVPPPVTPQLEPLRRVARAEQTEEDVAGLVDAGFVEVYNGQPVITQAGLEALPEAERPSLTPEARKIQIDTGANDVAAEAISKNLRIGVDQVPADVRMPEGWTLEGDVYVPPQPQAPAPTPEVREARREPAITPQQDRDYLDAVERGDLDAASRVVEDAATKAGFTKKVFRGQRKKGIRVMWDRGGTFTAFDVDRARTYADPYGETLTLLAKEGNTLDMSTPSQAYARGGLAKDIVDSAFADNLEGEVNRFTGEPWTIQEALDAMDAGLAWDVEGTGSMRFWKSIIRYAENNGLDSLSIMDGGDFGNGVSFVIFNNNNLKLADPVTYDDQGNIIPLSQRFQPEQADIRYARREPAVQRERFYSQLQRTVEAKMPNVSSPEQLKAIIDPTRGSGVKPEEVKWSGITEAIDRIASENNGRVPKEAVLKYLRDEGAVKFEEVTLLEKIQITPEQNRQIQEEANRVWEQWVDEAVEEAEERGMTRGMDVDRTDVSNNLNRSWDEAESEAMRILGISEEPQTKYQEYQLPEGENYREVVMAMPSKTSDDRAKAEELERKFANATITNAELQDLYYLRENADLSTIETYKSPHFKNIPNYVAHMRLNDRKDGDGKNGTFIEEIQSDLHQKAREVGYKDQNIVRQNFVSWLKSNKKELSEQEIQTQFRTQVGEEIQQWLKDQEVAAKNASAVPDAPFRKDWPIQMFKRALEQAVMSGRDWIGWTTGETQAERYDLSKQISEIAYNVDRKSLFAYDKNGEPVLVKENVTDQQITEYIGKEAAERLLNSPKQDSQGGVMQRLKGEELKVGGEGMIGFYDNILPKEVSKYVKKWGAAVEKSEIYTKNKMGTGVYVPIWRVNITPEMRQIIQEEGQAVFLRRLRGEPMAGMETSAVEARLQELGFPTGGIIRVVNQPDADFEGRTIILDGKVTGIELNASALKDNAAIDRVLNHEFAESANADGALNKLVERLTPKEKKEINDTITRLRYEERARTTEEAARAIETLAEAWKGRGFFTRAVARIEAWASKLGFKLTRRAAEYIAARNLADINSGFRAAYNRFINVKGEAREGRAFVTPEENARFLELAKDPEANREELQKMVDGAAKKAGYDIRGYHGTRSPAGFTEFIPNEALGGAIFIATEPSEAAAFGRVMDVFLKAENVRKGIVRSYDEVRAIAAAKKRGQDAIRVTDGLNAPVNYAVFDPSQIKSADPVTYDDQGNVIPLEQRFQPTSEDIRYARREVRESRREPEAIPTFTEGTPESATLKAMEASMAKVDAASEAKGGKPETYKISEIASVWMDSGLGERELQDAIVEYTNLTPANAAKVARAIAKQYGLQQQIAETGAVISEIAPEPEGAPRKSAVTKLIEQTTGVRKPVVKLQVSESAALKKQIQLKAREARETRKARKEAAEDLAKSITDYVKANPIRGPINSRQAMSITKKALKLDVNNEAAVDRFEMYVERVIENANYDRDLADARALIKRAKSFAKSKDTQGNVKTTLDAIANISPTLLDNPFEFNLVVQRYLLGLSPVTAKQYAVMPDADVRRYLESLETQIKDNQEVLDRAKAQRILDKQAAYAEEKGIPLDEAIAILNSEEFLNEKTVEKLEDLTRLLTSMAQESQKDVKAYDDSGATPKQKELISFMRKVNIDSLINEEKKRYIRFANNLLANGATFGMEQFQSIALGQEAAMKAVKDRRLSQKLAAWISPIGGDKAIDTARRIALRTQSEADTFKNIFGREAVGAFRNILGLNRLDVAQTDSNRAKEQIANEFGEYFKGLRKKYGDDATGFEAKGYAGIAGYLIQTDGNKTEAESIPYRRRLMEQNIAELRKSDKQSDLAEADLKEKALAQLTGTTNAEILSQLQALNPASYEQLMWVKDVMLPKWRDFLKEHDENFRNQANNYNNPDHLTITYKFPEGQLLPNEIEDVYQQDMVGMRIKQAANSIKRKDHPNLPVSKAGTVANIDINFGYNQYNALVDQVDKAFVAPAWEQVVAFTKAPEFEQVMGGRANALFVKNLLRDIQTSRSRQSITDDEAQLIAGGVRLARKISTQAVLGGITQPLRQVPDQLAKLFFTTGRFDLITKNLLTTAQAAPLLNKFPIGRRGDAQAGTQYASQFSELARKVEASVTDRKWAKYRELMNKVGEFWMTPLRGSDVWAAKVSWMSYYEAELNKKGIKMESWEREAELVDTDQDRKEAASYAEFAVDFYGGASDPTKMASLSKQTNNGWKEFAKLLFLPLNSFALQQKNSLISDLRDAYLRTGDRKASIAAIAGTLAGMAAFHGMRIYIIGGLLYPAGKALLMGIFGIDMDEPDEEEKQKQLEDNWRKFKASMYGNIVAGGLGEFVEKNAIDAVNRTAYLWDANINPDSLLNDKGEIMSFRQYEKEVSPLYRFRSYGSSEYSFGLADVLTEQATHAMAETQQLLTPEEMERYTGNEQAYAMFSTMVEWLYFFRLMDTDATRIARDLKRQMDKQVEEREAEIRAIRSGR